MGATSSMSTLLFLLFPFYGCSTQDQDKDGFGILDGDCDELNPNINPLRQEICDSVDNDCDGEVDGRYARGGRIYYGDSDSDDCSKGKPWRDGIRMTSQ